MAMISATAAESLISPFALDHRSGGQECLGAGRLTIRAPQVPLRLVISGGNWSNTSNAGVGYANCNNSLSNSNSNIGARLAHMNHHSDSGLTSGWNRQTTTSTGSCGEGRDETCRPDEMKRIGAKDLEDVTSMEVLERAADKACSTRQNISEVAEFKANRTENLRALQESLRNRTYRTSEYRMFEVNERGKTRVVADLPLYPDRIVHWAIALVLEDKMNAKLIDQTYASIPGRGAHGAVTKLRHYMNDPKVKYALQVDVQKFFPSIDKSILKEKVRHVLKDGYMIWLLDTVIDDYRLPGLPIGNRTSPMLANLYLSDMAHALKERFHVHYVVGYMDDWVVLGYTTVWLRKIRNAIASMLGEIGLKLKANWQIYPVAVRGVDFVGYRIYPDHVLLRNSTKARLKRACRSIMEHLDVVPELSRHDKGVMASYEGVLKWCDSFHLRQATLGRVEAKLAQLEAEHRNAICFGYFFNSMVIE